MKHGGPEYQQRKAEEKALKDEAHKARMEGLREGTIIGAKKAGRAEGIAKASRKGGIGGFMEGLGGAMQGFEKAAGPMVGDFDFGGIGGSMGTPAFGFGGGPTRRSSPKRRRSKPKVKTRTRYVYVERRGRR